MSTDIPWYVKARPALKSLGITYKDAAVELNISEGAVSHQINGRRGVSLKQIRIYATMLNMSVSELAGENALFVTDEKQVKAVELIKAIPADKIDMALKVLKSFVEE
jgi:transcriptional regulator with XRE-family HTH domain